MVNAWQEEAKKLGGDALVEAIQNLIDGQEQILTKLDDIEKENLANKNQIENIVKAFPNNDYEGHRRYHQTLIDILEEKRKLRIAIQEKTLSGLIWWLLIFFGLSAWEYIKSKVGAR